MTAMISSVRINLEKIQTRRLAYMGDAAFMLAPFWDVVVKMRSALLKR